MALARELGLGVEMWPTMWPFGPGRMNLFDDADHKALKAMLEGMTVSLHPAVIKASETPDPFEAQKRQIDAAADLGAEVLVVHPFREGE